MHRGRRTGSAFPKPEDQPTPSLATPPQHAPLKRFLEANAGEDGEAKRARNENAPAATTPQPSAEVPDLPRSPSSSQSPAQDASEPGSADVPVAPPSTAPTKPPIFCDLDGVLSDFDRSVRELCGRSPEQCQKDEMWTRLMAVKDGGPDGFYSQLPWMADGPALWEAIAPLNPIILSGCPKGTWAAEQKRRWCARELGPHVEVRTCLAQQKCHHSCKGAVLIDDRLSLRSAWQARGGRFVQHTSTANTLVMLHQLGVLPVSADADGDGDGPGGARDTP
eukprot:EG_transcript_23351